MIALAECQSDDVGLAEPLFGTFVRFGSRDPAVDRACL